MTKIMKHHGKWKISCDFSTGNTYRLWDSDGNFPANVSQRAMVANIFLMETAPELLEACKEAAYHAENICGNKSLKIILENAIKLAEGGQS